MTSTLSRAMLYRGEVDEIKKVTETLAVHGIDPGNFIRAFPLNAFYKDLENDVVRPELPGLRQVFPQVKETVNISATLAQLKVADAVAEGAEAYGYWKQVWRVEQMDTPKLSIPKASSADLVPSLQDLKATSGGNKHIAGGDIGSVDFDVSDDKGYYAVATELKRNWIRDNNFRAVETHLKLLGEALYYRVGGFICGQHISASGTTDTKANLDGASNTFLEAVINVIENKMPTNRFVPDSAIFHPADMYDMKVEQWGTAGPIPLLSSAYFDKNGQNVNNTGIAQLLGLKNVWVTPWATQNTVLVFNKMKSYGVGLRQDLEIEDFKDTIKSLVDSVLSMRMDTQEFFDAGTYKITSF